ncbi:hypothetical protein D9611_014383 [Ephemerocybe angulata]|uniref:Protein kinase domain-containing protein n=1 Tax=Ephemerocybe angulata TaxID=980116 RepID=A0A8H5F9B5_9AGAR|nr:hypothetical protein D9611_014383 [Tulosesus angulatus]
MPMRLRTRSAAPGQGRHIDVSEEKAAICKDIEGQPHEMRDAFVDMLYEGLVGKADGMKYLVESPLYDVKKGRWAGISKKPRQSSALQKQMQRIMASIISCLGEKSQKDTRQVVYKAEKLKMMHAGPKPQDAEFEFSSPDIVVKAKGPHFEVPAIGEVGYSNVTACFNVRREEDTEFGTVSRYNMVCHAGIYARQMFIQQPNRQFVRLLHITEHHLYIIHFDRRGAQISKAVDYHFKPWILIRLVLGLSSFNAADIGLDDSVKWEIEGGKKVRGSITTKVGGTGLEVEYPLADTRPIFSNKDIVGRGSMIYKVRDTETGRILVVKDTWRPSYAVCEGKFLEKAKGVPGIAQMVSFEDEHVPGVETMKYCPLYSEGRPQTLIQSRIVMEHYGLNITNFSSEVQLIGAMRDAIAGHMTLYLREKDAIIHRDISSGNLILGGPDAAPGFRGVLIDFDASNLVEELQAAGCNPHPAGTFIFASVATLRSLDPEHEKAAVTWNDHLDDLEAFLYNLYSVMTEKSGPSEWSATEYPEYYYAWAADSAKVAAEAKLAQFHQGELDLSHISPFWSQASKHLLQSFFKLIAPLAVLKEEARVAYGNRLVKEHREVHKTLKKDAKEHYTQILSFFDKALGKLEMGEMPVTRSHKRAQEVDDDEADEHTAKRVRAT